MHRICLLVLSFLEQTINITMKVPFIICADRVFHIEINLQEVEYDIPQDTENEWVSILIKQ